MKLTLDANELRQVVEHHRAPEGSGKGGDELTVEPPRAGTADSPRGIPAESIGHQPLAGEESVKRVAVPPPDLERLSNGWRVELAHRGADRSVLKLCPRERCRSVPERA